MSVMLYLWILICDSWIQILARAGTKVQLHCWLSSEEATTSCWWKNQHPACVLHSTFCTQHSFWGKTIYSNSEGFLSLTPSNSMYITHSVFSAPASVQCVRMLLCTSQSPPGLPPADSRSHLCTSSGESMKASWKAWHLQHLHWWEWAKHWNVV